jgi:uncharacterized protein YndB with AHSA1/START domain
VSPTARPQPVVVPAPVRKSVTVGAPPERAFRLFTAGMGRWWRHDYHIGASAMRDLVVEPRVGGRWYEVGEDGAETNWGKVLAWEPPRRVVLAQQINGHWQYDPTFATEVEVRFLAEGAGTRVELEHRNLDRYGDMAGPVRDNLEGAAGWGGLLAGYVRLVAEAGPTA